MLKLRVSGGVRQLRLPDASDPEMTVWRDQDGRVCAYGCTRDGEHWMHLPSVASYRFGASDREVIAIAHPAASPELIADGYRRTVLPMALQALGREVLHSSAVRLPRGVLGLCAVSGTGKSTIAYGLSRRGHALWADDAVAFDAEARPVLAMSLPFELLLPPSSAAFFDNHREPPRGAPASKSDGRAELPPAPLAAVCVLERVAAEDAAAPLQIRRLSPADAFPAVLAHAYCFSSADRERNHRMVERYLDLVSAVPVFRARLAAGLENLPAILNGIEDACGRLFKGGA
jgi:hypothetical protein